MSKLRGVATIMGVATVHVRHTGLTPVAPTVIHSLPVLLSLSGPSAAGESLHLLHLVAGFVAELREREREREREKH